MILCESNTIQKHNEEGGKEILEVGGSVAFANMAQKRMELGNGSQRTCIHRFLEAAPGGVRSGVGGNGGQDLEARELWVPAPLPESGSGRALPGAARGAGSRTPAPKSTAVRRAPREPGDVPLLLPLGGCPAAGGRRDPAPRPGARQRCPTRGSRAPPAGAG